MKYIILLSAIFMFSLQCKAQTMLFHEDFELPSADDSVTYTSSPPSGYQWNINTRLHEGVNSQQCDSLQVKAGCTIYMKSISFSTMGSSNVMLKFSQICKVDFLDIATIEVSNNNGVTWTQLTGNQYLGSGQYGANGNRFAANSYGNLWVPGTGSQIPTNTWWKTELFDCSALLANTNTAMVRFKLADGGTVGANNNKGWYIDNFEVLDNTVYPVSGAVTYDNINATPISNSDVTLVNSNITIATTLTDINGMYTFSSCPVGFDQLYVTTNKPWGGVNAADAQAVLHHFTGTQPLTGLRLMAADVTGDGIVNSADALMIMKRFVGLSSSFPVGDWVFEHTGFNIPQPVPIIINIKGLCYGDVNGSYIPPAP